MELNREHVFTGFALLGVIVCIAAGYTIRTFQHVHTVTRTIHVTKSWGKPDQSVSAAQVSPQLSKLGISTCDWFASKHTLVCHP